MKFLILTSESSYLRDIKQHLIEAGYLKNKNYLF